MSLLVVYRHALEASHWPLEFQDGETATFWFWGSMEVFFCISGFLITRNLLDSIGRRKDWMVNYAKKRALRIWPAYYSALLVCVLLALWLPEIDSPRAFLWNRDFAYLSKTFFFAQFTEAYWGQIGPGMIPTFWHSWSIALEEQFYVAILLVLFLRHRFSLFPGKTLLIPVMLLLPLSQLARQQGASSWILLGRTDGFLLGIALALLEPTLTSIKNRMDAVGGRLRGAVGWGLPIAGLVVLYPYIAAHGDWSQIPRALRFGIFNPYFAFGLFGALTISSIILAPVTWGHMLLRGYWIRYLGDISLSTYLFHVPVLILLASAFSALQVPPGWILAVGPIVSIAVAALTHRYIETPFLKRKSRLSVPAPAFPREAGA